MSRDFTAFLCGVIFVGETPLRRSFLFQFESRAGST
jgi:hypothetical protein